MVKPGALLEYQLLLRNNLDRPVTYEARLLPPLDWQTSAEFLSLQLNPGNRGKLQLTARAPVTANNVRQLMTAEIRIDGESQGQISEALVTVRDTDTHKN